MRRVKKEGKKGEAKASSFCEQTRRAHLEGAPSWLPPRTACYQAARLARERGVRGVEVTLNGVGHAATSVQDLFFA